MSAFPAHTGVTLDTGALITWERRRQRTLGFLALAHQRRTPVTVPMPVVSEWWRGRTDEREKILQAVMIEDFTMDLAKLAGAALAAVPDATTIDAIVMASAAQRGDVVFTSDFDDLSRLQAYFPNVRILSM